jgi:hypothetical protein
MVKCNVNGGEAVGGREVSGEEKEEKEVRWDEMR